MSSRRKERARIARQQDLADRAEELRRNHERLVTMDSGLTSGQWSHLKDRQPLPKPLLDISGKYRRNLEAGTLVTKRHKKVQPLAKFTPTLAMSVEEYEAREKAAKAETERKRKMVAIAYNKGPYMMITPETDPTTIGRK